MGLDVALMVGASLLNAYSSKKQADKQADAQDEYTEKKYQYDLKLHEMGEQKLKADWAFAYDTYEKSKANEQKVADYTDAMNLRRYNYDLKVRNAEQKSNMAQFHKSNDLYNKQVSFNQAAAISAADAELTKLEEINKKAAFDTEDRLIKAIQTEGQLLARGVDGVSSQKAMQALLFSQGTSEARLVESLVSAEMSVNKALEGIARDKYGADLAAFASKMLDPGVLPYPIATIDTPIADFQAPRALQGFDFGPDPIKGVAAVGGSWLSVASASMSGIAKVGKEQGWKGFG